MGKLGRIADHDARYAAPSDCPHDKQFDLMLVNEIQNRWVRQAPAILKMHLYLRSDCPTTRLFDLLVQHAFGCRPD